VDHTRVLHRDRDTSLTSGLRGAQMFETRTPPEPDKILRLMGMFAADPRPDKVDLGVGVYRSPEGITPVMAAVKTAERRIWETQETKSYVGIPGDPAFSTPCAS
jgi:aspartate aminotransferase